MPDLERGVIVFGTVLALLLFGLMVLCERARIKMCTMC